MRDQEGFVLAHVTAPGAALQAVVGQLGTRGKALIRAPTIHKLRVFMLATRRPGSVHSVDYGRDWDSRLREDNSPLGGAYSARCMQDGNKGAQCTSASAQLQLLAGGQKTTLQYVPLILARCRLYYTKRLPVQT